MRERWEILETLINTNHCRTIAEIGVSKGDTSRYVLDRCQLDKYYLIDPDTNGVFNYGYMSRFPHALFLRVQSNQAVHLIKDNELDLVFIDADHSYEHVTQDIQLWKPKVKKKGIICGHDYDEIEHCATVKRAVDELLGDVNLEDDVLHNGQVKVWWRIND